MSKSSFPGSPDHAATLRRMNFLVVLLVISNIATGIFSVYLLRKVDQRYSELVGTSVPVLNDLRELMTDTVAAMRATNPRNFSGAAGTESGSLALAQSRLGVVQKFRGETITQPRFADAPLDLKELEKHGEEFERIAAEVIRHFAAGNAADALRAREEKLLPAFDLYVSVIGKAADAIEKRSLTTSRDYTAKTRSLTAAVLGVAGWPLLVGMALLLLTVCFVVVLMFVFRGKELGDMP